MGCGGGALTGFIGTGCGALAPDHASEGVRPHLLDVIGVVADGQLQLSWTYSENVHEGAAIEWLASEMYAALRQIMAHCADPDAGGCTPSDFPLAGCPRLSWMCWSVLAGMWRTSIR